jgi:hypothetical protein
MKYWTFLTDYAIMLSINRIEFRFFSSGKGGKVQVAFVEIKEHEISG